MGILKIKRLRIYAITLGLLLLLLSGLLIYMADSLAQKVTAPLHGSICCETPADFGAQYQSIQFLTADGLELSGWYIAPRNGALIILLHSYYADRRQTLPIANMLYQAGYGLLLYDQRASGESQGTTRSLGWRDIPDLGAAVRWLGAQNKHLKIGAYGCSTGGAIALAGSDGLSQVLAVAVDAPSPLGWTENLPPFNPHDPLNLPVMALYYPLVMLRSGSLPPISTLQAVWEYGKRPLLFISSGQAEEYARVSGYAAAAPGSSQHWNIPDATHCAGSLVRPQDYGQHLTEFFNTALIR